KLKAVLDAVLSPYGLTYAVVGDTVVVSTEEGAASRVMRQRVNVAFDKVELARALKRLSRDAGAAVILDSRAEKVGKIPVSRVLEDVPLETAVRLLSAMAGLKPVRVGDALFVTTKAIANELRNDPDVSPRPPPPPVPKW